MGVYSASPDSLAGGEGLDAPPEEPHVRCRPSWPRAQVSFASVEKKSWLRPWSLVTSDDVDLCDEIVALSDGARSQRNRLQSGHRRTGHTGHAPRVHRAPSVRHSYLGYSLFLPPYCVHVTCLCVLITPVLPTAHYL